MSEGAGGPPLLRFALNPLYEFYEQNVCFYA